MSILDYSVARGGYLVNEHVSVASIQKLLDEAQGVVSSSTFVAYDLISKWADKIRPLGNRARQLQFETNLVPDTVEGVEVLNGQIRNLSDDIAKMFSLIMSTTHAMRHSSDRITAARVMPVYLQISANMANIRKELGECVRYTHFAKKFGTSYQFGSMLSLLELSVKNGLSDSIVEPQHLIMAKDEYALEFLSDYKSFAELFDYVVGSQVSPDTEVQYATPAAENVELRYVLQRAKETTVESNAVVATCGDASRLVENMDYTPYKSIAKASVEVLNLIYENGGTIPQQAYDLLMKMAFTTVNLFNLLFLSTYDITCGCAGDLSNNDATCDFINRAIIACNK